MLRLCPYYYVFHVASDFLASGLSVCLLWLKLYTYITTHLHQLPELNAREYKIACMNGEKYSTLGFSGSFLNTIVYLGTHSNAERKSGRRECYQSSR